MTDWRDNWTEEDRRSYDECMRGKGRLYVIAFVLLVLAIVASAVL